MKRGVLFIALAFALSGCAHTHLSQPLPDYTGSDAATLYIQRPSGFMGGGAPIHVVLDGALLGVIGDGEYWKLRLKPGKHSLGTWTGEHEIVLKPGQTQCYGTGYALNGGGTWMHVAEQCPPPGSMTEAARSGAD